MPVQTNVFVLSPRRVTSLASTSIVDVACGEAHTLAIDNLGTLYSFGKGSSGQLGTGLAADSLWPVRVDVLLTGASTNEPSLINALFICMQLLGADLT